MSLTNEDRDLIDRQFDQELTEPEQQQFDERLKQDDFRQAVYLRELVQERVRAVGREQLKDRLKDDLRAQRAETVVEPEEPRTKVRPMFGSSPPGGFKLGNPVRWAIAASVVIALAAALFILLPQRNDESPTVAEGTEEPTQPVRGNRTETPTYGGAEAYGQYDIATEGAEIVQSAILQVDASRSEAQFQMIDGTLYIYYPTELPEDATLELAEENDMIMVTIEGDIYRIDPAALSAPEAQPLERAD